MDLRSENDHPQLPNETLGEYLRRRFSKLQGEADIPPGPLGRIQRKFAEIYAAWGLILPREAVAARTPGGILDPQGWVIVFRFGRSENREYIEIFSTHRLGSDSLDRICEGGEMESFAASEGRGVFTETGPASFRVWDELIRRHHTEPLLALLAGQRLGRTGEL
jgi:hypothetical protein